MRIDPVLVQYRFPHPVAVSFVRLRRSGDDAARLGHQLAMELELVRFLALTALADYLAGEERDNAVEALLRRTPQPDAVHWLDLLLALRSALAARTQPPFMPELLTWLADDDTETPVPGRPPGPRQPAPPPLPAAVPGRPGAATAGDHGAGLDDAFEVEEALEEVLVEAMDAGELGAEPTLEVPMGAAGPPLPLLAHLRNMAADCVTLCTLDEPWDAEQSARRLEERRAGHERLLDRTAFLADYVVCSLAAPVAADAPVERVLRWRGPAVEMGLLRRGPGWRPPRQRPYLFRGGCDEALALYPLVQVCGPEDAPGRGALALLSTLAGRSPRYGALAQHTHLALPIRAAADEELALEAIWADRGDWFRREAVDDEARDAWCPLAVVVPSGARPRPSLELFAVTASGGDGVVYRGRDHESGEDVAVRVVHPTGLARDDTLPELLRRVQARTQVQHPNLVSLLGYEASAAGGGLLLLSAAMDGGTLADLLEEAPIAPPLALEITIDVLAALATLHEFGYAHNAVTADAVQFTDGGFTRLADVEVPPRAPHGGRADAPGPGEGAGAGAAAAADQHAVARLLYELLTGLPPDPVTPVPPSHTGAHVPALLDAPLLRALAQAPGGRFPQAGDFRAALEDVQAALPEPALPEPPRVVSWLRYLTPDCWAERFQRLRGGEAWRPLLTLHRERARVEGEPAVRLQALVAAATVAEEGLGDDELAAALWESVFSLSPGDARAARALERLLPRIGRTRRLVTLFEDAVRAEPADLDRRVDLERRLARLHRSIEGHSAQAAAHWRAVLERQPGDPEALAGLVELSARGETAAEPAVVLPQLLRHATSDAEWLRTAETLATLWSTERYDPAAATALWKEVLDRHPGHPLALFHLARACRLRGDWRGWAALTAARVEYEPDPLRRTGLRRALARVYEEELGDVQGAIDALKAALAEAAERAPVRAELERLYRKGARWKTLVDLLLTAYETEPPGPDRNRLLLRLADVFLQRLDAPQDALTTLQRAVIDHPDDRVARFRYWTLAERLGAFEDACDVIEEILPQLSDIDAGEYGARAARAAWFRLGDAERTRRIAQATVERAPEDRLLVNLLVDAATKLERWEDVIRALERVKALVGGPAAEARFHLQLARIFEQHVGDPDAALARAEEAVHAAPDDPEARLTLVRLLGAHGRWDEQAQHLRALEGRHPRGEAFRLLVLAKLYKQNLDQPEDAIESARGALETEPDAATHTDALLLLAELHRARKEWTELSDVLSRLVADDGGLPLEQRVDLLDELAVLEEEQFARPEAAIRCYRRIVELAPGRAHARESLLRLTAERADDESRAAALRAAAHSAATPEERRGRLLELADLLHDRLGRPPDALDVLAAYGGAGGDEAFLTRQARWLRETGATRAEEETVEALARKAGEPLARARWKTRLAELWRARDEADAAVLPLLRDATLEAPHCDEAHAALVEHVRRGGDKEILAEALEEWARSTHDERVRADALVRLAELRLEHADRRERATVLAALESALEAAPEHLPAARLLLALCIEDQRWERCPPLVELELAHLPPGAPTAQRAGLHRLRGDVELHLGEAERAVTAYERALALAPRDVVARVGLAAALRRAGRLDDARTAYSQVLEVPRAELSSDVLAQAHRALDEIDRTLGDQGRSLDHLERALREKPDDLDALRAVLPQYEKRGDWGRAVDVRRRLVEKSADGLTRFNHLLAIGEALLHHLDSPRGAVEALKAALVIEPDSQAARIGLLDAQLAAEDPDGAVWTLEALIDAADTPQRKAALHHTLAALHLERRGDEEAAIRHFHKALDLDPERLQTFADLDALLAKRGDHVAQARSYKRMLVRIAGRGDDATEHRLWYNLGQLYARYLDRKDDAITALEEAVLRRPEDLSPRRLLAKLLDARPETRDRAVTAHRELLRYRPREVESYQALRRHFAELGRFDAAWCAAGVLDLLGAADEREKAFLNRFRTGVLQVSGQPLDLAEWQELVLVAEEDKATGELFALFAEHLGPELQGARPKDHGLGPRELVDLDVLGQKEGGAPFRDLFRAVVRLLGSPQPPVYRRTAGSGIRTVATHPAVVTVGEDLLTSHQGKLVRFELAKSLAYHHPWHRLAANLPVSALHRLLEVAVRFTLPESNDAGAEPEIRGLLRHLRKRLAPGDIQHLNDLGHRLKNRGPLEETLARWGKAVERTTNHVGLLLANDVAVAVQCIRRAEWTADRMGLEEQVDDLLRYAVSDEYGKLRRRVGIQIR